MISFHQERSYIKHQNLCLHEKLCAIKIPLEPNTKLEDLNDRFRVISEPMQFFGALVTHYIHWAIHLNRLTRRIPKLIIENQFQLVNKLNLTDPKC